MKRLIGFLLIISFALSLVGCKPSKSHLNGVNLKKFSIVYSEEDLDYSKRAAQYIQSEILKRTDLELPLVEDSEKPKTKYEIVVGNTEREISSRLDADTKGLEFAILAEETQIAIEGDCFIIAAAAYFFIESYVPSDDYDATIPTETTIHQPIVKEAENFILLIGDGMGLYQTKLFETMTNNVEYSDGEDRFYGYLLPYHGFSRTASLSGITDSAAGGTALACGTKTVNEYVGKDKDGNDVKSLTELAFELGMGGGVMSTEADTGATPSTFSAHAFNRDSSLEIMKSQLNAKKNYGTVIECNFNYYKESQMSDIEGKITETVDKISEGGKNFFLMYEEAHIDKHCHNNDMEQTFNALVRFNQAIGRFMEYAFYNPNTFVLITADHETGDLYPDEEGVYQYHDDYHSLADVPVFAYGMGAELFDDVTVENIQIAHTIAHLMGDSNFGDQSEYTYLGK